MTARGEESITRTAEDALFGDISELIEHARTRSATAVNSELVMLYWSAGKRVRDEVLGGERAMYGQAVVKRLAMRLAEQYGRGWSRSNLLRMIQFADDFTDGSIVATLSQQLSWSHLVEIVALADADEPGILFRDPYVLDFLGLPAKHTESELEAAILEQGFSSTARATYNPVSPARKLSSAMPSPPTIIGRASG